MPIKEQPS